MRSNETKVMVALQTKDGLNYGYLHDLVNDTCSFEVNSKISAGEEMAFRMELKGYEETVMGMLRVTGGRPASGGNWPMYQAKILEIPEFDRQLLEVWVVDQRDGGSTRRVERNPDEYVKDMFAKRKSGASTSATKLIIQRMNERKERRAKLFKKTNDVFTQEMKLSQDNVQCEAPNSDDNSPRGSFQDAVKERTAPPPTPPQDEGMDLFDLDELD